MSIGNYRNVATNILSGLILHLYDENLERYFIFIRQKRVRARRESPLRQVRWLTWLFAL